MPNAAICKALAPFAAEPREKRPALEYVFAEPTGNGTWYYATDSVIAVRVFEFYKDGPTIDAPTQYTVKSCKDGSPEECSYATHLSAASVDKLFRDAYEPARRIVLNSRYLKKVTASADKAGHSDIRFRFTGEMGAVGLQWKLPGGYVADAVMMPVHDNWASWQ